MLLHWCNLVPEGSSSLSAIRFTEPVRVRCIRIFPSEAVPFSQIPEAIAYVVYLNGASCQSHQLCLSRTEPDAFMLEVFFNALPVHNPADGKPKPKASNALVSTLLAYVGEEMEFTVGMGADVRLLCTSQ